MKEQYNATISFATLIKKYAALQSKVVSQVRSLASSISKTSPGKFLLAQFGMSQITQIGESISNLIAQANAAIMGMVRNQKTQ